MALEAHEAAVVDEPVDQLKKEPVMAVAPKLTPESTAKSHDSAAPNAARMRTAGATLAGNAALIALPVMSSPPPKTAYGKKMDYLNKAAEKADDIEYGSSDEPHERHGFGD